MFVDHTLETAPPASRRAMTGVSEKMGYLPAPVRRLAESPHLLDGFLKLSALFEATTLDPVEREVVIFAVATRNSCEVCVAIHTAKLAALGAAPSLVAALREQRPLDDERLEALRVFTLEVIATAGAVDDAALRAFLEHGFTTRNALEVVLGIGAYTTSTLANRLTRAPLDEQLADFAWRES
ncbi:carboxymuconolactone decarboxylase family protein [Saccharomonospora xinjiangensis]|uniref:Alkylhydroperoxidase AhpD family core domain protein n=1 Tax=Saccharomonospora xinjiangensis XJ-54 TaxID=882086 RepID=I0V4H0_9PSEU|nr:carboxymuconolactone decarboxylase family protein [Saccharomonospora xinjiangensis]EID55023.1 alkylhydroperoxidase AhpD family core domain protein [Saccharomonospora xinjiangensis XJ-54]